VKFLPPGLTELVFSLTTHAGGNWRKKSQTFANEVKERYFVLTQMTTKKGVEMPNINPSYSPMQWSEQFRAQRDKLESLSHAQAGPEAWAAFDRETEQLLRQTYGEAHQFLESYVYACMAEAEALLNMPESAQESLSRDLPQKAIQQRRQLLTAVLADLETLEAEETEALTGEDHEDPPSL
jgi:hypothetical protein